MTATDPGRIILRVDTDGRLHGVCMPSTALLSQDWYRIIEHGSSYGAITLTGEAVDLVRFELANGTWVYRLVEYDGLTDAWLIRWVD